MSLKDISENEELEIERPESETTSRPKPTKDDIQTEKDYSASIEKKESEVSAVEGETDINKLKEMLEQAEDRNLRIVAEFENYKKRNARQFDDIIQNAEAEIFKQVLEITDNFKLALEKPENQKDFGSFKSGMKMIYGQMNKFLEKHKIEQIESVGQKFDPELHEAVMQIESDQHPEGVVASEVAGGFRRGERVIRHAKVGVSQGKGKK